MQWALQHPDEQEQQENQQFHIVLQLLYLLMPEILSCTSKAVVMYSQC